MKCMDMCCIPLFSRPGAPITGVGTVMCLLILSGGSGLSLEALDFSGSIHLHIGRSRITGEIRHAAHFVAATSILGKSDQS